jgi:beta-xylosidase
VRPALAADFPDPDVIRVGSTWWAYATGSSLVNLQARSSPDMATWSAPVDPLPTLPAWATQGFTWAPAVTATATGFVMYYSVRDANYGRQCLSVASSLVPSGPFVDSSAGPITCQTGVGGSIDPEPFTDSDGARYLLWKSEDNALGRASRIGVQRLAEDGLSVTGDRPRLLTATASWQAGVVEGPTMIAADGAYYLFYGANHWDTSGAGIGYALCASPMGPCRDESWPHPWLGSSPDAWGPSGPDVFTGPDGRAWIAYHAWSDKPEAGKPGSHRQLWISPLTFVNGEPVIG